MSDCGSPKGYQQIFSQKTPHREAKRYRRKGLDPTSRSIVEFLKKHGVEDRTLLEAGLEDRIERRVTDFAEAGAEVEAADIVVMNRVICCYQDMPKLTGAAADHTRGVLVITFPRDTWWMRLGLVIANFGLRIARRHFRIFLHSPEQILATAAKHGLRIALNRPGVVWQIAALDRVATARA